MLQAINKIQNEIGFSPTSGLSSNSIAPFDPSSDASVYQSSPQTFATETEKVIEDSKSALNQVILNPEPESLQKLSTLNQKRQANGKPPIDFAKTTKQIESIMDQKGLSDKEKKKQIETLRKQLGLSKSEMKKLFTKRLEKIYKNAAQSLQQYQKSKESQLKTELQQAEQNFGKNSPQAQEVKQKMDILHSSIEPQRQQYAQRASFYNHLYPSFWSQLGGFFKKLGAGFTKVLGVFSKFLKFIPGISQLTSLAGQLLRPLKYLFTGHIVDFFKSLGTGILKSVSNLKSLLPLIPGVGTIASAVIGGVESLIKEKRTQN
jgi:hypothetical protein